MTARNPEIFPWTSELITKLIISNHFFHLVPPFIHTLTAVESKTPGAQCVIFGDGDTGSPPGVVKDGIAALVRKLLPAC